jgi:integrase
LLAPIKRRAKRSAQKSRLTELSVRKAKPKSTAYLVWDTHQRGLALRVQPTGAKAWVVVYSRHGRPRWLTLGKADGIGLSDARRLAAKAVLAVAEGKDVAAEKKAERGAGTFAELAARYVEIAKRKNKSWEQGATLVARYATPRWAKLQAASISRADVRTMLSKIDAPVLRNQVLASTSAVFTWATAQELIAANPCRGIERNKVRSRERVLSDSELPKFWKAFGEAGPQGKALKAILLLGQRPGEICNWRREHIVDGWWEMPGEPVPALGWPGTKNAVSHRVRVAEPARDIIASEETTGFVFGSRGRPVHGLDAVMRDICTKLGVNEKVTPHDLRRTFSTKVTALGFGRDALNRVTNHKEGGIATVYDRHGYADENERIMNVVAAHILALAEGKPKSNVVRMAGR